MIFELCLPSLPLKENELPIAKTTSSDAYPLYNEGPLQVHMSPWCLPRCATLSPQRKYFVAIVEMESAIVFSDCNVL